MATASSLEDETSSAISQMSQGMGDICPIVNRDQRGYNRSQVSGTALLLRGVFGESYSDRDEDLDSVAVALGPH